MFHVAIAEGEIVREVGSYMLEQQDMFAVYCSRATTFSVVFNSLIVSYNFV